MKKRITNIFSKKSKILTAVVVITALLAATISSAVYLEEPPENIKVAYFSEPEQIYNVGKDKDVIENYINEDNYNIKYNYSVESDEVKISGVVNGKNFDITSKFWDTSYNGARMFYSGEDSLGNYEVKLIRFQFSQTTEYDKLPIQDHGVGERARHKFTGWFGDYAKEHTEYKNVLELNLNPVGTDDIVVIEIFLEDDFITEYITKNNIKCTNELDTIDYEGWTISWCNEHGVKR